MAAKVTCFFWLSVYISLSMCVCNVSTPHADCEDHLVLLQLKLSPQNISLMQESYENENGIDEEEGRKKKRKKKRKKNSAKDRKRLFTRHREVTAAACDGAKGERCRVPSGQDARATGKCTKDQVGELRDFPDTTTFVFTGEYCPFDGGDKLLEAKQVYDDGTESSRPFYMWRSAVSGLEKGSAMPRETVELPAKTGFYFITSNHCGHATLWMFSMHWRQFDEPKEFALTNESCKTNGQSWLGINWVHHKKPHHLFIAPWDIHKFTRKP
eukprot:gnl/TRDRNA2_/TRDRNA2_42923_c0_seq1.p1 gnl/TRDRNA2_/TRDRNA2_42923_c0~~gnl/TRDRNA2_/TRDRNA2_42923_c0_seq1.p1  ORF type:complete len:293 (-),score=24.82 gnl/TRDRNA2_/TRDRNA2_42923_c0_seq1:43-849(-)